VCSTRPLDAAGLILSVSDFHPDAPVLSSTQAAPPPPQGVVEPRHYLADIAKLKKYCCPREKARAPHARPIFSHPGLSIISRRRLSAPSITIPKFSRQTLRDVSLERVKRTVLVPRLSICLPNSRSSRQFDLITGGEPWAYGGSPMAPELVPPQREVPPTSSWFRYGLTETAF